MGSYQRHGSRRYHHKNKDKQKPFNYGPVSLTYHIFLAICKLQEKIIKKQLVELLEKHNMISCKQFGLMSMKSLLFFQSF